MLPVRMDACIAFPLYHCYPPVGALSLWVRANQQRVCRPLPAGAKRARARGPTVCSVRAMDAETPVPFLPPAHRRPLPFSPHHYQDTHCVSAHPSLTTPHPPSPKAFIARVFAPRETPLVDFLPPPDPPSQSTHSIHPSGLRPLKNLVCLSHLDWANRPILYDPW